MGGYLNTNIKCECFGCEACAQICPKEAITMQEDTEGFRYPVIDFEICVGCGQCNKVCPYEHMPIRYMENKYAFGGYNLSNDIKFESTSGGAFSAIVEAYCDKNYVIFGAESKGLLVFHSYITDKKKLKKFRKSKYSQSIIGNSYKKVKQFLTEGKKVLFSGTPCQIAGLKSYLGSTNQDLLLTVEVICEGVPSPLYVRKYEKYLSEKFGTKIFLLDYRYKGKGLFDKAKRDFQGGRWDFEAMRTEMMNRKVSVKDRWFNPFWSIWLNHLMSRPSCYKCPFTSVDRVADITLGDLWGVHIYCPELYGKNGGSSLVVCNTEKGRIIFGSAKESMYGHELLFEEALKYQSPMRKTIGENPDRDKFMQDLKSNMDYVSINKKWAKKPSLKLLWSKYIWGNRQKVFLWNLKRRMFDKEKRN